jgi:hypothetical protein
MVWISRRAIKAQKFFVENREVQTIDSTLASQGFEKLEPTALAGNRDQAFEGAKISGAGFIISAAEAASLLAGPGYDEVVSKYLTGEDVNSDPRHQASRWVINFKDRPLQNSEPGQPRAASHYTEALGIVETRVKPERLKLRPRRPIP